ncbi:MAG: R3H domain-containing nucleic acid-binding protein [Candidatus Colwellbacteria bacterium]|nr:R3H domain-containing nucleic acid-binding protein [Candidatus Colwellbacteria bacterium]
MQELHLKITKMVELMGFNDFRVEPDSAFRKISIVINDTLVRDKHLPALVSNLDRIVRLMAKQVNHEPVIVDINNYRREREELIVKLAKAAARKAALTGEEVSLPAMNAYERRLIHTELAMRPDVTTESTGTITRYVIVRPI